MQAICNRKLDALDALYERYKGQGFGLAYRITSSREAAEEVLQDAFLSVWRRAETFAGGPVRPWLFSIIHHRAVDYLRRPSRPASELDEAVLLPGSQDVFSDVYANISREKIKEAMSALPAEQRQALELFYFGGMTFTEIAQTLDVPSGTLKSRVRLGLARLRTALKEVVEL